MSVKDLATKNSKDTKKAWPLVRLGDVCESFNGLWKGTKQPLKTVGVIRSTNFTKQCEFDHSKIIFIEVEEKKFLKRKLQCGDIVVERSGGGPNQPVGRVLLFNIEEGDYTISNFTSALRIKDKCALDSSYLHRVLVAQYFSGVTAKMQSNATNIINLHYDEFLNIEFPLPPLTVQREIVARLEKELGEADKLAAKFKRVAELADNAFKAELDETFKTLEDNLRRDAETRRVRLGDVCERITKGTTPTSVGYCFVESGINFVKIESFSEDGTVLINRVAHISPECHLALKRSQLQAEDVLFSIAGAIGRVAIVGEDLLPANTNQALAIIRTSKEKSLDVKFLKYSLCSCSVKEQYVPMQKTTAQSNLSLQNVSDFILSTPTLDAQRAIVAKLDAAKERCEKLKAAAMRGHAAAENLRKAILAEAFEQ